MEPLCSAELNAACCANRRRCFSRDRRRACVRHLDPRCVSLAPPAARACHTATHWWHNPKHGRSLANPCLAWRLLCATPRVICCAVIAQDAADVSREASTEEAEASRVRLKLLERRLQLRRLYRKVLLAQMLLDAERCARHVAARHRRAARSPQPLHVTGCPRWIPETTAALQTRTRSCCTP